MRTTPALVVLATFLAPFATAATHKAGICVAKTGGQNVYQDAATKAACTAYSKRNTGDKQWDKCPDCTMKVISDLNVCNSEGSHIGGDELEHYCKQNGAAGSLAD